MGSLTIGMEFITGRCVAAEVSDRHAPEWPPHPGRVFMALAASCFEMGETANEVAAIKWLEKLPPPLIHAAQADERSRVSVYVPVNDKVTASKSLLQTTPGLSRPKQERSYPTVIPSDPVVKLVWEDAPEVDQHIESLATVCRNVIRVGHSSSLVRAWATNEGRTPSDQCWRPAGGQSEMRVRVAGEGEFERLRIACNAQEIEQFGDLVAQIETTKGKKQKETKAVFEATFGEPYKNSLRAPEPTPPVLGLWQGYSRCETDRDGDTVIKGEHFDSELLILSKLEGRVLGAHDTLALTRRFRDAAMSSCPNQPPPAWLSGHETNGQATKQPHVAFLALPYVGGLYADGHVMGLALALPKRIPPEQRGKDLGPLLVDEGGNPREIELKLGGLGEWTLAIEDRESPPKSLRNESWIVPSRVWASVTPVVLDRFPKTSRSEDRNAWTQEVCVTISLACERAGLPRPAEIDIDTTSWHEGTPRAFEKVRRLRSARHGVRNSATLGDGFPTMQSRPGKPQRPQVHVYLRFHQPVSGPVLLGAGRFVGYGLCKPLKRRKAAK